MVHESQHTETFRAQKRVALLIVRLSFQMLVSIELDDELRLEANEIGDVRPDKILPPEFISREFAIADMPPESSLGVGFAATHLPRFAALPFAARAFFDLAS